MCVISVFFVTFAFLTVKAYCCLSNKFPHMNELIPRTGNYKKLLSYQKADAIFQITFDFCARFLSKGDRTVDQMVQAARSGKQ